MKKRPIRTPGALSSTGLPAGNHVPGRQRGPKALAAAVAGLSAAVVGGTDTAHAQLPGARIGPPYFVEISHEGQLALIAGYAAAPGAIVCIATTGAAFAVTPVLVAYITPIVQRATGCPDNGMRRLELQNILVPPRPGAVQSEIIQVVESNACLPAR